MGSLFSQNDIAFRNELRAFFSREIPQSIRDKVSAGQPLLKSDIETSHRVLNAHGMAVPHWPKEWGGRDWTAIQRYIFVEELLRAAVPLPLQFNVYMVGPVIATFGTEEQKRRFLPRAANLDDWWCQGFSEPNAGSDLASLRTKAVRRQAGYIVNGQKTWTTYGHHADWMFCLVRTDATARMQAGISFLLIDMKSPGVTVRPLLLVDGRHEVNEVFFDNVEVPLDNLVGVENKGWDYAKFLLGNERSSIARIGMSKERIARVRRLAQSTRMGAGTLWDLESFRMRVLSVELELKALEYTQLRVLAREADEKSEALADPASSILKIKGSQLQQATAELLMEVAGPESLRLLQDVSDPLMTADALSEAPLALANYMNVRKVSIYGGSNEIQRNIVAKSVLKL
jgi:alkylation response protein AidB-like acyl-CoA dehydrogenase